MKYEAWINACALRLAQLGVPEHFEEACTLGDEQREKHGASAIAWERPSDVAERFAADEEGPE